MVSKLSSNQMNHRLRKSKNSSRRSAKNVLYGLTQYSSSKISSSKGAFVDISSHV